jgi:Transmembrane domain of unknown function (DUF3566)
MYQPPPPGGYQGQTPYPGYPTMQQAPLVPARARRTIRRVSIGSAIKVGAFLNALAWAIFGLIFGLCSLLFSSAVISSFGDRFDVERDAGPLLAGGFVSYLLAWLIGIVVALIAGAVIGFIYAILYNLTAGMVGGLEVDIE